LTHGQKTAGGRAIDLEDLKFLKKIKKKVRPCQIRTAFFNRAFFE